MARSARARAFRPLTWLGTHEMTVLLALAGIAAGVWGFALLADEVLEGGTQAFDRKVLLAFRYGDALAPLGPPWVQEGARDVTSLGGTAVLTLVTVIAAGFLALDGKGRMADFTNLTPAWGYSGYCYSKNGNKLISELSEPVVVFG